MNNPAESKQQPVAMTPGLLPIFCPKCGLKTEAVMPDEMDRLVSLCCWSTIPGTEKQPPEEQ